MDISENIKKLIPYKPGKTIQATKKEYGLDQVYKLASNESPVGLSQSVIAALSQELNELHRYPDPNCTELKGILAEKYSVEPTQIVVGNGSNELIDLLIRTFCVDADKVLTSESAFIAYKICAKAANIDVVEVPLNDSLEFDIPKLVTELNSTNSYKLVFIANPNNPTGTAISEERLMPLLDCASKLKNTLVVLDEAYNDFVRQDDFPDSNELIKKYDNLVILKTLSKVFGLAGLRVGYLVGSNKVCDYINRIRNPFNVNRLAQVAAVAALADTEFLKKAQDVNWNGLDYFYTRLDKLNVTYWKSQANFVLIDTGFDSLLVFEALLKCGVITRPVKAYKLPTHIRISVGKDNENTIAMDMLEKVLNDLRNNN